MMIVIMMRITDKKLTRIRLASSLRLIFCGIQLYKVDILSKVILQSMMIVMLIMLWMMKTMMMTTLPRTLCCHLPNKAAVEVR